MHTMTTGNSPNNKLSPWQPGQSGNPTGRPKGTRDLAGYVMTNAASGNFLTLSVWETEADMLASESDGFSREQFAKIGALMAGPPEFDHYELSVEASAGDIDA